VERKLGSRKVFQIASIFFLFYSICPDSDSNSASIHLSLYHISLCLASPSYYLQPSKAISKQSFIIPSLYISPVSRTVSRLFPPPSFLSSRVPRSLSALCRVHCEDEWSTRPMFSLPGLHCVGQTRCLCTSLSCSLTATPVC